MTAAVLNHLWQSTLFACLLASLTLALPRQAAASRYWLWLIGSTKFLVPFSALVSSGAWLASQHLIPRVPAQFKGWPSGLSIAQRAMVPLSPSQSVAHDLTCDLLCAVWLAGIAAMVLLCSVKWLRMRSILASAQSLDLIAPVPVRVARTRTEPALLGIRRPVILLPEGLTERLSAAELECVIAHEVAHLRRGDNLTAAIHMSVTSIFWFHPLTWWLGSRLLMDRELACDERVIASGHDRKIYAQALLKVCRLYIGAPVPPAAGAAGADLQRRIAAIMTDNPTPRRSEFSQLLIAVTGLVAVAVPLACGLIPKPPLALPPALDRMAFTAAALVRPLRGWSVPRERHAADAAHLGMHNQNAAPRRRANFRQLPAHRYTVPPVANAQADAAYVVASIRLQRRIESNVPAPGSRLLAARTQPPRTPLARPPSDGYSLAAFESLPFVTISR